MHPGLTQTDFGKNAIKSTADTQSMQNRNREGMPAADSPDYIAERILETIRTGEAEVRAH